MSTAIRVGNEESARGALCAKKTQGATTLLGKNVKTQGGKVDLDFVGKHGKSYRKPIGDEGLAKMLLMRKETVGNNGLLFGISYNQMQGYVGGLANGKGYTPHNFRTLIGTRLAREVIKTMPAPKSAKERKTSELAVGISRT